MQILWTCLCFSSVESRKYTHTHTHYIFAQACPKVKSERKKIGKKKNSFLLYFGGELFQAWEWLSTVLYFLSNTVCFTRPALKLYLYIVLFKKFLHFYFSLYFLIKLFLFIHPSIYLSTYLPIYLFIYSPSPYLISLHLNFSLIEKRDVVR